MFGKANPSLLPNLPLLKPTSLAAPSFSTFKFDIIGKEPSLLSRISDKRADDPLSRSSSPMSGADYIAFPPDSETEDAAAAPLDRKSLLQALTNAEDSNAMLDVDGDTGDQEGPTILPVPTASDSPPSKQSTSDSIASTPHQPNEPPLKLLNQPEPSFPVVSMQEDPFTLQEESSTDPHDSNPPTPTLMYPMPEPSDIVPQEVIPPSSADSPSSSSSPPASSNGDSDKPLSPLAHPEEQASSALPPNEHSTLQNDEMLGDTLPPSLDTPMLSDPVHVSSNHTLDDLLTLHTQLLSSVSDLANLHGSDAPSKYLAHIVSLSQEANSRSNVALAVARRAHFLAEQSLDSAKQALASAQESLRVADESRLSSIEATKGLEGLQDFDRERQLKAESLKADLETLGQRLREYATSVTQDERKKPSSGKDSATFQQAVSPLPTERDATQVFPPKGLSFISNGAVEGKDKKTQDSEAIGQMSVYEMWRLRWAPETEADIARRAWEAQRSSSVRRPTPLANKSPSTTVPAGDRSLSKESAIAISVAVSSTTDGTILIEDSGLVAQKTRSLIGTPHTHARQISSTQGSTPTSFGSVDASTKGDSVGPSLSRKKSQNGTLPPQPERRSTRNIVLTDRVQHTPEMAQRLLGDRQTQSVPTADTAQIINSPSNSSLQSSTSAPSSTLPTSSNGHVSRVGNPVAQKTLLSLSLNKGQGCSSSSGAKSLSNVSSHSATLSQSSTPSSSPKVASTTPSKARSAEVVHQSGDRNAVISDDRNPSLAQPPVISPTPRVIGAPSDVRQPSLPPIATWGNNEVVSRGVSPSSPPQSPLIYATRQTVEKGNLPFTPYDSPVSAAAHLCNTQHVLGLHGIDWQEKAIAMMKVKEEIMDVTNIKESYQAPLSKLDNDTITVQSTITIPRTPVKKQTGSLGHQQVSPAAKGLMITIPRSPEAQQGVSPSSTKTHNDMPVPNIDKAFRASADITQPSPRTVPTQSNVSPVVTALNSGFEANGGLDSESRPSGSTSKSPVRSAVELPTSVGRKRKLGDDTGRGSKAKSPSSSSTTQKGGLSQPSFKRSRQDANHQNPPQTARRARGDHWSPPRSSGKKTFAPRVSLDFARATPEIYRSEYDAQYEDENVYPQEDYGDSYSQHTRYEDEVGYFEQDQREIPELAMRMSSQPQHNRGRGKARGGHRARRGIPNRGFLRSKTSQDRVVSGHGGLESRITDAPLSLGDRIGS